MLWAVERFGSACLGWPWHQEGALEWTTTEGYCPLHWTVVPWLPGPLLAESKSRAA